MTRSSKSQPFIAEWLFSYRKEWLRPDVLAGLTTAAVVIPKAMAYATIAGLPVQVGLYTAFLPMVIYAVLGTSRPLSVSTTTTLAILTAAELGDVVPSGDPAALLRAAAMLTLLVGAILVTGWLAAAGLHREFHLGAGTDWLQSRNRPGDRAGSGPKDPGHPLRQRYLRPESAGDGSQHPAHFLADACSRRLMIVILVGAERLLPRAPAPLIAVAAGIAGAFLLGLKAHGVELVGLVPRGLPSFRLPDLSLAAQLWPGALGIALMSFTETIAAGRAFVTSRGETA